MLSTLRTPLAQLVSNGGVVAAPAGLLISGCLDQLQSAAMTFQTAAGMPHCGSESARSQDSGSQQEQPCCSNSALSVASSSGHDQHHVQWTSSLSSSDCAHSLQRSGRQTNIFMPWAAGPSTTTVASSSSSMLATTRAYSSKSSKTAPEPKTIVSEDSPLLVHYKRDIHPRQLTYRMQKRNQLSELSDMVALYEHKMDHIAAAAALTRLYRLQKHDPTYTPEAATALLTRVQERLSKVMRFVDFRTAATCLWALAGLQLPVSQELVTRLLAKAYGSKDKVTLASPKHVALVAWGASKLLSKRAADPDAKVSPDAKVQELLSNMVESTLQHKGRLEQFGPRDSAMLGLAMAAFTPADARLFTALGGHALRQIGNLAYPQYEADDYVGLVSAFGRARVGPVAKIGEAVARELTNEVRGTLYKFSPAQMVGLVEAYATAGLRQQRLLEAVAGELLHLQGGVAAQLGAEQRARLAAALAKLGYSNGQLARALEEGEGAKQAAPAS